MNHSRLQTLIISGICLVAIVATAIYTHSAGPNNQALNQPIVRSAPQEILSVGTSTDWQKQFFDGGSATSTRLNTKKSTGAADQNLTATDKFGRDFFTTYVQLRQAGLNNDSTAIQSASDKLINESVATIPGPTTYTLKNISILANPDKDAIQAYGKTVLSLLAVYLPKRNEAVIAMDAFDQNDMSILKDIDPLIVGYKAARTVLLSTPAPEPLARYHVDILNAFNTALFSAEALRVSDADPLRGLAAISFGGDSLQKVGAAITAMQQYFVTAGIPFGN